MKLLLTRPFEQSAALKKKLEKKGHEIFCLPLIEILPPPDGGSSLQTALQKLSDYDWLVVTSQQAVKAIASSPVAWPPTLQAAAAGPKTASVLREAGFKGFCFTPEKNFGSQGLIEFFESRELKGKKIFYPCSSIARDGWIKFVREKGAIVDAVVAYRTVPSKVTAYDIFCLLNKGIEAVAFFSPSAVKFFFELIRPADERIQHLEWIPFGPTTAKALALFKSRE